MLLHHAGTLDLDEPLRHFREHGYARLGRLLHERAAGALTDRARHLMAGPDAHPGVFYQHDSPTGRYEDLDFRGGWVGPSPRYRKLERLELDPLFAQWIENPLFARLAHRVLGDTVTLYRSVLWNKAPKVGMAVPWHQDDGRFWGLDRPPILQIWTALDEVTLESGCLEIVPGTHLKGLATPEGGTIPPRCLEREAVEPLRLPAHRGECILVHNHLWHRTGRNHTAAPRRALSVSFLAGDTRCTRRRRAPRRFRRLFS